MPPTPPAGGPPPGGTPTGGPPTDSPPAEPTWSRLHPLTPLLRGGRAFLVLGAVVLQTLVTSAGAQTAAAVTLALLPPAALYGYVSWRYTRWRLDDGDLRLETGVLFRRSRRVPLARLQAVDVVRGLAARALGLAELRLEVVGGGDSEAPLAYLGVEEADRVRALLLRAARATTTAPGGVEPGVDSEAASSPTPEAVAHDGHAPPDRADQLLVQVPPVPLLGSVLLSTGVLVSLVFAVAALAAAVATRGTSLALLLPVLLILGGTVARELQRGFGFTLSRTEDGLRLSHGLLETRTQTVPRGRVQAVRMTEPLLWRLPGWARLEVDVAGYGGGAGQQAVTATLLPVGPRDYAAVLAGLALDGLDLGRVPRVPPPRRARWLAPLAWPRMSVGGTPEHLVVTSGVVARVTVAAPWVKVQSLRVVSGPLQRRLGLATFHVDTAGRFVQARAEHRSAAEALRMLDRGADLARRARTVDLRGQGRPPGGAPEGDGEAAVSPCP